MLNFYRLSQDYLKFTGNERLDLINRLSTNLVKPAGKFQYVNTVLTSDKGRFIDLLGIFDLGDLVFAECSFRNSANVISHLEKYTIMDDFNAENLSGSHEAVLFIGNNAASFIEDITGIKVSEQGENVFSVTASHDAIIVKNNNAAGGFKFIYSLNDKSYWDSVLFTPENFSKYTLKELSDNEYETLRVELGIPAFGKEMSDLTNPLECGMERFVSFTKGCYIGQEVIARLDAYDKISKHLIGLRLDSLDKALPEASGKIYIEGKECGFITSSAYSEKFGSIALGFIKTIFLNYDKTYLIKINESSIECKLTGLPFTM